jgi:hypothetical protein
LKLPEVACAEADLLPLNYSRIESHYTQKISAQTFSRPLIARALNLFEIDSEAYHGAGSWFAKSFT